MRWQDPIAVNPLVVHGEACIRGTRIPVAVVLANLADGLSRDDIIRSYPSLTREGIQAAPAYAADLAQNASSSCRLSFGPCNARANSRMSLYAASAAHSGR